MSKKSDIIQFILGLAILTVAGILGQIVFTKFDLTEEKRHTLTQATIEMLENLDDQVFIKCYLHGTFPAKFKRLEQSIQERFDEFVDYSDGLVSYEFIDPYESGDEKTQSEVEQALYEQGLRFTVLSNQSNGTSQFNNIWPGAIITYKNKDYPVQLFKSSDPDPTDAMVNASINNIEFEMASHIRYLTKKDTPAIAVLEGHGELSEWEMIDLTTALKDQYAIERVKIDGKIYALSDKVEGAKYRINKYDLLIVAKPDSAFDNKDKLVVDQFIMNGGKVLWMIDPIMTDLDSLRNKQQTLSVSNDIGLYDMLFDYGVRLNRSLVLDYQCAPIAFDAGPMGNQRNYQLFNWYYAPVILSGEDAHPIVSNLDPIVTDFTSSMDFVGEDSSVHKTVLLQSSELSKALKSPIRITTGIVNMGLDYFQSNPQPRQIIGSLLEGVFKSNFDYRLPDTLKTDPNFAFRRRSRPTKMIVIADGDIARNKVIQGSDGPMPIPLGFDRYAERVVYDNKEFLLNAVNYLMDDNALISMRSRSIVLRKLNNEKIIDERTRWQIVNVVFPLFLIGIFGVLQYLYRRKKYTV